MSAHDEHCMARALHLAARGRGWVEPNPLVGCVISRDGAVLGEGWHARFGDAHAEVAALRNTHGSAAGATLYVNLEPCCHTGKTPPCTEAIIAAGITRVVTSMTDPFPAVAGHGLATLRAAGIQVELGLLAAKAQSLNAPFVKRVTQGLPWVVAKWAMTADGKLAARDGSSRWISSAASRVWVHTLRGHMDAIAVGITTALRDDPLLTARPPGPRIPLRVVYDRRARLPVTAQLVQTARDVPTWVFLTEDAPHAARRVLEDHGCQLKVLASDSPADQVRESLRHLCDLQVTHLLLEGGSELLGAFWDARAIDEVHVFIAPILIGGAGAPSPLAGLGIRCMPEALPLQNPVVELLDGDILLSGRVAWDRVDPKS